MKLSVIVPVYNSKRHLEKCLYSLLKQSFQDFEIVLIDDGSTDSSLSIAQQILAGRLNCTIITKTNGGVATARNIGLQNAKGEWIAFVDSDDYLDTNYLEIMVSSIVDCDLLISGIIYENGEANSYRETPIDTEWRLEDLQKGANASCLNYIVSVCGKLFRKEILDSANLRFDETMTCGEDRDFCIEYLFRIKKVKSIAYVGYHYQTDNPDSLTSSSSPNRLRRSILYWNKLYRLLNGTNDAYLAHRLFYFIIDIVSAHIQRKDLFGAIRSLYDVHSLINKPFLCHNLKAIRAPFWQKVLIRVYLG